MNLKDIDFELVICVVLLAVAAFAIFKTEIAAWFKRVKGTKGAQKVIADTDAVVHTIEAVVPHKTDPAPAVAPTPAAASDAVAAAHAALDKAIADHQAALDAASAAKAKLTADTAAAAAQATTAVK